MDHDQRTTASQQQDPVLAARIVRGIADIERDFYFASDILSERLMREAVQAIGKVATAPWQVVEAGWSAQIVCPEWKMTRGVGTGDAWLELTELCTDEENDHSWIAAAVKAGPTQMCFELIFRKGLLDFARQVIGNDKALAALWKFGFVRVEDELRLFIPIDIPAEALALGFEQNDLTKALAPIGKAVELALSAKAELDKLVEQVRGLAKLK
jgi:hypothetical protein